MTVLSSDDITALADRYMFGEFMGMEAFVRHVEQTVLAKIAPAPALDLSDAEIREKLLAFIEANPGGAIDLNVFRKLHSIR